MLDFCCFEALFDEGRITLKPVFHGSSSFVFPVRDVDDEGESVLCEDIEFVLV